VTALKATEAAYSTIHQLRKSNAALTIQDRS